MSSCAFSVASSDHAAMKSGSQYSFESDVKELLRTRQSFAQHAGIVAFCLLHFFVYCKVSYDVSSMKQLVRVPVSQLKDVALNRLTKQVPV